MSVLGATMCCAIYLGVRTVTGAVLPINSSRY